MRRLFGLLMPLLIALASVVLVAGPASAHHTTVSGKALCADDGTWTVTWKVSNWSGGGVATVTSSSRSVVPAGTTIADGATKTFTETVTEAADLTLSVTARWPAYGNVTNSGKVWASSFPGPCVAPDEPVTPAAPSASDPSCTEAGRLVVPADTEKVRYTQTPAGTGPGTYQVSAVAESGYRIEGEDSWTITVQPKKSGPECATVVTPVAPDVTPINACGTYGFIGMVGTEGISYRIVEGDGRQGAWKVVATAEPGYRIADGARTEWSGDLGTYRECVEPPSEVTPVAPTVAATVECQTPGALRIPTTEGVEYRLVEGDGKQGPWKVVATAEPGHRFADGVRTEWTGDLGTMRDCGVLPEEETQEPTEEPTKEPTPKDDEPTRHDDVPPVRAGQTTSNGVLPNTGAPELFGMGMFGLLALMSGGLLLARKRDEQY